MEKGYVRWPEGRLELRLGPDEAALEVLLAIIHALVADHGAVVTDVDLVRADLGSVTVRVPAPAI